MTEKNSDLDTLVANAGDDAYSPASASSEQGGTLVLPYAVLPGTLYLIPVPGRPLFPAQIQPIVLAMKPWRQRLERVAKHQRPVLGLLYCGDQDPAPIDPARMHAIGCAVRRHRAHHDRGHAQISIGTA